MAGLSYRPVEPEDADRLFAWRRADHVAAWMTTPPPEDFAAHLAWLRARANDPAYLHWVIMQGDTPVGLVNLQHLDRADKAATWGFYIGDPSALGLGGLVPPALYNAVFAGGFEVLEAGVIKGNDPVASMHSRHGYVRVPEKDRNLVRGGAAITLEAYRLTAEAWGQKTRFHRLQAVFPGLERLCE